MKKFLLSLAMLTLAIVCLIPMEAHAEADGDFLYSVDDSGAIINRYNGSSSSVVVPALLDGHPVIGIGYQAFKHNSEITEIQLPDTLQYISGEAFYGCTNLTSIILPDSVATIGDNAFAGCSYLTTVYVGKGLTGWLNPFENCYSLKNIYINTPDVAVLSNHIFILDGVTIYVGSDVKELCSEDFLVSVADRTVIVDENNPNYCSDEYGVVYNKDKTILIKAPVDLDENYIIPESVKEIVEYAFANTTIKRLTVSGNVKTIGNHAFENALLEEISLEKGVKTIGESAFSGSRLTSIEIPKSVEIISSYTFYDCRSLSKVTLPNSITHIGDYAFANCPSLKRIILPGSLESIGSQLFKESFLDRVIYDGNANSWVYVRKGDNPQLSDEVLTFSDPSNPLIDEGDYMGLMIFGGIAAFLVLVFIIKKIRG